MYYEWLIYYKKSRDDNSLTRVSFQANLENIKWNFDWT